MLAAIDFTMVLEALIYTVPAIIAAIYAGRIHQAIRTPSGKSIGEVAEYAHDTGIANNMLLRKHNGPTKPLDRDTAREEGSTPPSVPVDQPAKSVE